MRDARILFVDLDDTVRLGKAHTGRYVNSPSDVRVFPEAVEQLRAWRNRGGYVIGVTNQGGIGLGYMDSRTNFSIEQETIKQTGNNIDKVMTCPHTPKSGCFCRKPLPGLILRGADWVSEYVGIPKVSECFMVGDLPTDAQAAARAGIRFQCAECWRMGATVSFCNMSHSLYT